jgi:hypothetical protein
MKIELVIDELVLHGFDPRQRHAIADAVEDELTRLVRAHTRELSDCRRAELDHADGGSFEVLRPKAPADAGRGIARSLVGAVLHGDAAKTMVPEPPLK